MGFTRLFTFLAMTSMLMLAQTLSMNSADAANADFKVEKRYLYVQPGQTIFSIVKVLYPDQKENWPVIINEIVKKNPHAFERGVASQIRVGERIELASFKSGIKPATKMMVYKGPESVGQVMQARGKTFAISAKNVNRELAIGSEIFVGDRLFTGVDGFMRLSMIDEAKIDMRCNSEVLIEDYRLLRAGNRSIIHLIKGSLRKVTGSIGKMAEDVYEMRTPMATVGVRGTDYAIRVLQSHGCDGSVDVNSDGLFVKVNAGAIDLKNKSGTVGLNEGDAAHVSSDGANPQNIRVGDGVFDAAEEEGSSWWKWLLVIVLIAAAA